MVFCNLIKIFKRYNAILVTILILVDGFLQFMKVKMMVYKQVSHNPYFSRWFSAIHNKDLNMNIATDVTILILVDGFLQ